jgi:hypothetical protein
LLDESCAAVFDADESLAAALEVALELEVEAVESDDGAGVGVVIAELDGVVEEVIGGGSDDDFVVCRSPQAPSRSTALIASIDVESFMAFLSWSIGSMRQQIATSTMNPRTSRCGATSARSGSLCRTAPTRPHPLQ